MPPKRFVPPRPTNTAPRPPSTPASTSSSSSSQAPTSTTPRAVPKSSQAPSGSKPLPSRPLTPAQHQILLRHRLSHPTVSSLLTLGPAPPPDEILAAASRATELTSFPLRPAERALFSHLNTASPAILWPLAVSHPTQTWEKAFLLSQAHASGEEWIYAPRISTQARSVLLSERRRILRIITRVLRCAADLMGLQRDGAGLRMALELARSITAGAWEGDDGRELLQVPGVGAKKMDALVKAGVRTVKKLAGMEFFHIERLLKRNPPFGQDMIVKLEGFPKTGIRARVERWATPEDVNAVRKMEDAEDGTVRGSNILGQPVQGQKLAVIRAQVWVDNAQTPKWREQTPWVCVVAERGQKPGGNHIIGTRRGRGGSGLSPGGNAGASLQRERELLFFWRGSTKKLTGHGQTLLFAANLTPGEVVYVWASCEEVVGTLIETIITAPEV